MCCSCHEGVKKHSRGRLVVLNCSAPLAWLENLIH